MKRKQMTLDEMLTELKFLFPCPLASAQYLDDRRAHRYAHYALNLLRASVDRPQGTPSWVLSRKARGWLTFHFASLVSRLGESHIFHKSRRVKRVLERIEAEEKAATSGVEVVVSDEGTILFKDITWPDKSWLISCDGASYHKMERLLLVREWERDTSFGFPVTRGGQAIDINFDSREQADGHTEGETNSAEIDITEKEAGESAE